MIKIASALENSTCTIFTLATKGIVRITQKCQSYVLTIIKENEQPHFLKKRNKREKGWCNTS